MKKIAILALLGLLAINLLSYSMLDRVNGNYVGNFGARTSAMGGAMAIGGIHLFDGFINPANITSLKNGLGVEASFGLIKNNDDRSVPMYDSFSAYSGNAVYASNVHFFGSTATGASYTKCLGAIKLSGALIYKPYIDFNSKYEEEVRNNEGTNYDNYPPILANNSWDNSGAINSYNLMIGLSISDKIALGLNIAKYSGNSKLLRKLIWTQQARDMMLTQDSLLVDESYKLDRDFDAIGTSIGLAYNISERLNIGFSFKPKVDFDVTGSVNDIDFTAKDSLGNYLACWGKSYKIEQDSTGESIIVDSTMISYNDKYGKYIAPARMRLGFNFKPQNIMRTNFNFDFEFVKWSDSNPMFDDAFNFYVGVEHKLKFSMPLRLGFSYTTDYKTNYDSDKFGGIIEYATKVTMPTFSVGTGFEYGKHWKFDISGAFSHRKYYALDLFPDTVYDHEELWNNYQFLNFENRGWENPDSVNEDFLNIKTSITFNW